MYIGYWEDVQRGFYADIMSEWLIYDYRVKWELTDSYWLVPGTYEE